VKYLYKFNDKLYCNRCKKMIDKYLETIVVDGQVMCIYCDNWITTEFDAFGIREEE